MQTDKFMLADRRYCCPLTITDFASRDLLTCGALATTKEVYAFTVFERAFKEFGLPRAIRTDNWVPFASAHARVRTWLAHRWCTRRRGRTKCGAGTSPGLRPLRGSYFYLYLIMDVWSRRIVGWRIAERESADVAAALITQSCSEGNIDPRGLVLHSDNGGPMRGSTMISMLQWLGVIPSFSRPHVSDDNPYSEALFRTLKHTPAYPRLPFADLALATRWVARFVEWYNGTHRRSAIRCVTPDQRHHGRERAVLASRHALYERVRRANPERWSRSTRKWLPVQLVVLNPERAPHQAPASLARQQP